MEKTQKKEKIERTLQGVVVTAKAEKTVSVSVERVVQHSGCTEDHQEKRRLSWLTTKQRSASRATS